MDGLLHGLAKVVLGGDEDDRDDGDKIQSSSNLEERSRSSWAEVVSSGQEENRHSSQSASRKEKTDGEWKTAEHSKDHSGQWASRKEDNEGRSDGEWKNVGNMKEGEEEEGKRSDHNSGHWGSRKEENEGRSDGDWETVGHKKQQQPHPSRRPHKVPVDNWHTYKRPPVEQEFMSDTHHGVEIEPSREELAEFSKACSRLWELDFNRLVPGKDYEIDCGEGKKVYQKGDMASGSLFSWLNDEIFRKATYARFSSLLDNYNPNQGYKEVVTSEEKHEEAAFIEEISRTAPIKYVHKYLVSMGIAPEGYEEFKRMLTGLWFDLYGRQGGSSCSSAFEHVFVGEIKGRGENAVSGFHNWIQFYLEEAKGSVDYQGYIFPRRRGQCPDSETQLLTLQFEWNGVLKSVSSTLVGVSPEFEIALYTLCFFMGGEDNHIFLGPYAVNIKCYRLGKNKIGSVFPIAES